MEPHSEKYFTRIHTDLSTESVDKFVYKKSQASKCKKIKINEPFLFHIKLFMCILISIQIVCQPYRSPEDNSLSNFFIYPPLN
jgi:hypothetical protein